MELDLAADMENQPLQKYLNQNDIENKLNIEEKSSTSDLENHSQFQENLYNNGDKKYVEYLEELLKNSVNQELIKIQERYVEKVDKVADTVDKLKESMITKKEFHQDIEEYSKSTKKLNNTNIVQRLILGFDKQHKNTDELEWDFFTMMMINDPFSWAWFVGLISVSTQLTLAIILILDQIDYDFFGTTMMLPVRAGRNTYVAQFIVIVLSVMTQTDLVMGIRNMAMLPLKDTESWKGVIYSRSNKKRTCSDMRIWIVRVFIPVILKMIVGALVLITTFFVIVQSESIVELLKDFSALLIISSIDDIFFFMADTGYFGVTLSDAASEAKGIKMFKKDNKKQSHVVVLSFVVLTILSVWIYIISRQVSGVYMRQAYPLCPFTTMLNGKTFMDYLADDRCEFTKGVATNIAECGWDGGDCLIYNERYPNCEIHDHAKMGDGHCDYDFFNTRDCGFDNGDCILENPKCDLDELSKLHNGICDLLESDECGNDEFDCAIRNTCTVNKSKIGDGICDGGKYNSFECGYDHGDCNECKTEDMSLVGDGFCDDNAFMFTDECGYDGGDCMPSINGIPLNYTNDYWAALVPGADEFLYGIPKDADRILKIDTNSKLTTLVGDNLGSERRKWSSGVKINSTIYGIPWQTNSILRFDIESEESSFIAEGHEILMKGSFHGGVAANNGMIYMFPSPNSKVVKFDPFNETHPLVEIGDTLNTFYLDGSLGGDGNIYAFAQNVPENVLKIKVIDDSVTFIDNDSYTARHRGTRAIDGNIYSISEDNGQIIEINVKDQSVSLVGTNLSLNSVNDIRCTLWDDFVEGSDGYLYGIPCLSDTILRFDPIKKDSNEIPLDGIEGGWTFGVRANNGFIYALPIFDFGPLLEIGPLKVKRHFFLG